MSPDEVPGCALCQRLVPLTRHHLIPQTRHKNKKNKKTFSRQEVKTRVAWLCRACHANVHACFSEKQLEREYNTLELLAGDERIQRFSAWVRKQKPGKRIRVQRQRSGERDARGRR